MAKAKIPNQKKAYERLNKRLSKYVGRVRAIYDELNLEASKIAARTGYDSSSGKEFRFSDYPNVTAQVKKLQERFVEDLKFTIVSGISTEWENSNEMQDLLADKVMKAYNVKRGDERTKRYYQVNNDALKSFQQRKDNGMNLSQKLWNQSEDYKLGLESALSTAIERGMSAVILSKKVSKYLKDFDSLKKDYKQKFGTATKAKDCEYRSIRLARSEINMAYRSAEQLRWQQMDFILGYEIKLSHSHPCADICDDLAGRYPKDFKWTGWHPNDLCYVIPIIKSEELFWMSDKERGEEKAEITDVPQAFKVWVANNIQRAKGWSNTPYFIRDNGNYIREDFKVNVYDTQEKSFVRKRRTKLAMSRIEYYKSIYPHIPEVRMAAINAYTQAIREGNKGATFREINKRLRKGIPTEYVDVASELISKGLNDLPKVEGIVYRGTHLSKKKFQEIYLSHIGDIIEEKAFISSSMMKDAPIQFLSYDGVPKSHVKILFEIQSKKGRDISKISEFNGIFTEQNQYEVLFDKGTKFRIDKDIEEVNGIIRLRLIEI